MTNIGVSVFRDLKRVLTPGGVVHFAEGLGRVPRIDLDVSFPSERLLTGSIADLEDAPTDVKRPPEGPFRRKEVDSYIPEFYKLLKRKRLPFKLEQSGRWPRPEEVLFTIVPPFFYSYVESFALRKSRNTRISAKFSARPKPDIYAAISSSA